MGVEVGTLDGADGAIVGFRWNHQLDGATLVSMVPFVDNIVVSFVDRTVVSSEGAGVGNAVGRRWNHHLDGATLASVVSFVDNIVVSFVDTTVVSSEDELVGCVGKDVRKLDGSDGDGDGAAVGFR